MHLPATLEDLLSSFGEDIGDPEEESFQLFSQNIPSQDLGFVDAKATSLEITIPNRELSIQQSPTLLSSNRERGTTGAVVWKITPLFAQWILSEDNILFRSSVFDESSAILELGSGSSGIVAIALAPRIGRYIATDQEYVFKLLKANIKENNLKQKKSDSSTAKHHGKPRFDYDSAFASSSIQVLALDWESSLISSLPAMVDVDSADVSKFIGGVIACDCIYNESLSKAFFGVFFPSSKILFQSRNMKGAKLSKSPFNLLPKDVLLLQRFLQMGILIPKYCSKSLRTHMC